MPRQRRKSETPAALYAQVAASGPKRVAHEAPPSPHDSEPAETITALDAAPEANIDAEAAVHEPVEPVEPVEEASAHAVDESDEDATGDPDVDGDEQDASRDEQDGPIHRRLIRASLPRPEGQQPPARPIPEFTIRQPGGRPNRFRPRHQRGGGGGAGGGGGHQFNGNRSNGNVHGGPPRGMRPGGGRPPQGAMAGRRHNQGGRKRSK